jgi:hypothetical protein
MTLYRNEIASAERDEHRSAIHALNEWDRTQADSERWHDGIGPDGEEF